MTGPDDGDAGLVLLRPGPDESKEAFAARVRDALTRAGVLGPDDGEPGPAPTG